MSVIISVCRVSTQNHVFYTNLAKLITLISEIFPAYTTVRIKMYFWFELNIVVSALLNLSHPTNILYLHRPTQKKIYV